MSTRLPFTRIEEAVYNIEQKFTPWNIQAELETSVTVDLERLKDAIIVASGYHPMLNARQRAGRAVDSEYVWEIPEDTYEVAIGDVELGGETDLERARNSLYFNQIDLAEEPPLQALVVRGDGIDGGDRLMVSMSHVAADGVGTLRAANAMCQAYRGNEPFPDTVDLPESREMLEDLKPRTVGDGLDILDAARRHLVDTVDTPTRIAVDGGRDEPGWGFTRRELSVADTKRIVDRRPEGVSVNDAFMAALHMAIEEWNDAHGESARKISVMMPINLRPDDWFYEVMAMYSMFESVTTRRRDRESLDAAARNIADQTAEFKDRERGAALYEALELLPSTLPMGVRKQLPSVFRGPGKRLLDTAMLTNLGRIPAIPSLAEDSEERAWFTPPVWEGTPVGVGVATFEGNATFCFRYLRSKFDEDGAEAFADIFIDNVEAIAE